jgi:sentrin-specific protease 1
MTKLLNEGHPTMDGQYEYRQVKRWSKLVPGKDLFALDKIFFPINQGFSHWICAVVFMKEKRIQMYDSLHGPGMPYLEAIFRYLKDDYKDKKGGEMPDKDEWELVVTQGNTPNQHNGMFFNVGANLSPTSRTHECLIILVRIPTGFDCGVFTCMFADFISKNCPLVFSQHHITQCRERIALSIMNGIALM